FDATKVHSSGFVAPYTLSQGLDRTLQYEFVHAKKDDITFVSE
ncbi:TPA: UDP-N-acetylglucosamine 4-epimerase, partial [Escherichia coli O146]|nr:UDP-N-acetylglucosamine 4-epimerase [Escherichia coli O146]